MLTVPWTAVPGYDFAEATKGMSQADIRREILIDWSATSGAQVYTQYNPDIHVAREPLGWDPNEPLACGWDWGGTPAFVVTQLNQYGQWLILSALAPVEGLSLGTYEFGQMVADHLLHEYARPAGLELEQLLTVHFGDPYGAAPPAIARSNPGAEARSHFEIIRDGIYLPMGTDDRGEPITEHRPGWGWVIIPGGMTVAERLEAVRARLSLILHGGLPALLIDPRCEVIKEALGGGYHYKQRADGRYELDPEKNWHSHATNALEYVCTRLFVVPEREDPDEGPRREVRSAAAGRRGRR